MSLFVLFFPLKTDKNGFKAKGLWSQGGSLRIYALDCFFKEKRFSAEYGPGKGIYSSLERMGDDHLS
jgi:hypothetical protein